MSDGQFRLTPANGEQPPVVTATGDIDLANVGQFEDAMTEAATTADAITVDLSRVSYCDSASVRALFAIAAITKLSLIVQVVRSDQDPALGVRPGPRCDRHGG